MYLPALAAKVGWDDSKLPRCSRVGKSQVSIGGQSDPVARCKKNAGRIRRGRSQEQKVQVRLRRVCSIFLSYVKIWRYMIEPAVGQHGYNVSSTSLPPSKADARALINSVPDTPRKNEPAEEIDLPECFSL